MRIACLQFAPEVGDVDNNLSLADEILERADPEDLDLLVLPELAFSGYNFSSLSHISPYLEHVETGISSLWARTTALKHDCTVVAGYPEKVDLADAWPANPEYYNSAVVVNADGEIVANYRKSHLYYTDETWALEGSGFFVGRLPGLPRMAMGICMDINPYRFEVPWDRFEFAHHILDSGVHLVVVSMAWLTLDEASVFTSTPEEPDMNTLTYWVSRMEPLIRLDSDEEIIMVFGNRTGIEGSATYAGTSAVVGIQSGEVRIYGILGRGEKDLLVVDTNSAPLAKLVYRPEASDIPAQEGPAQEQIRTLQDYAADDYKATGQGSDLSSGASTGFESDDRNIHDKSERQLQLSPLLSHAQQARITQQFFTAPMSPAISESHLSVSSLDSSRLYWLPMTRSMPPVPNNRWTPSNTGRRSAEQSSLAKREENRWSMRSDVSVWNAQHGRPRDVTYNVANPYEISSPDDATRRRHATSRGLEHSRPESGGRAHQNQQSAQQHYRNYTHSSNPRSSHSAAPDALGLHMSYDSDDNLESDEETLETGLGDTARWIEATAATVGRSSARPATENQARRDTRRGAAVQGRSASARQPPRAASRDARRIDVRDEVYSEGRRQAPRYEDTTVQPILQPASRSRVIEGNREEPGPEITRPATDMERRSAHNLRREFMHSSTPRHSAGGGGEARASSRGRQRATTNPPEEQAGSREMPRRHRSAQNSRGPRQEPIDLSQFRLIEEYPSANCPVHGSRSRSRHGHSSTRQRTPGGSRRRSRAREDGGSSSSNRRPRGAAEQEATNGGRSTSTTRPGPSSRTFVRRAETTQPVTRTEDIPRTSSSTAVVDGGSRQVAARASTLNFKTGPKTPKAMVFIQDDEETPAEPKTTAKVLSSLKCVDRDTRTPLSRPRSAVW